MGHPFDTVSAAFLHWAIVGAGKISHDFALALRNPMSSLDAVSIVKPIHNIVAVAARDLGRAHAFAQRFGISRVYTDYKSVAEDSDINVVYIGTVAQNHYKLCKMMLEHNKHVVCEKPLCLILEHTEELINLAKARQRFFMEAISSRFFPVYRRLRHELHMKSLGDIQLLTVRFAYPNWHLERMSSKEVGGGALHNIGVYMLAMALMTFGDEMPVRIQALAEKCPKENIDRTVSVTLQYANGGMAQLFASLTTECPSEAYVCGASGFAKIPHPFWSATTVELNKVEYHYPLIVNSFKSQKNHGESEFIEVNYLNGAGMRYEADEVARCIMCGTIESPLLTHKEILLIATITQAIKDQIGISYQESYEKSF